MNDLSVDGRTWSLGLDLSRAGSARYSGDAFTPRESACRNSVSRHLPDDFFQEICSACGFWCLDAIGEADPKPVRPCSICQPELQRAIPSNPNSNRSHWRVAVDRSRLGKIRFVCTNQLQPGLPDIQIEQHLR